ncbi:uncharacterized protein UBRO_20643 [Ustilago bromivora]|uniref:Reverse transcriptase Ty1/copia-type domain-containing protein n=1 Tax=Ustilago bromivora TaxID=307758 RepID=A0A1K0G408_9BASI|nr:uncharacterized protein UBRO_20643 [Ustilago bromivora]
MSEIQEAGEITINMDAICTDLNDQLDDVMAEGGISTDLDVSNDTSQLESPQLGLYGNYTLSSPKPPSSKSSDPLALLSFMAFATRLMNGIALAASGQQLCSADGILLEPSLLSEAQNWDDWTKWKEAMIAEMDSMQKMDIFELVDLPTDGKLIGIRPAIHLQTVCILLTLAHRYKLHVAQLDMSTAFLNGKVDKTIHVRIPPMFKSHENNVPCVYVRGIKDAMVILAIYVDDLLVIGVMLSHVKSVRQQLSSVFSITDQGNVSHIIGMKVKYDREAHTLSIDQSGYIKGTLEKFASEEETKHYASLVGSLLWIKQGTHPNIAFAVGRCTQFIANPSGEHLIAAKWILKYLKGTIDISLVAKGTSDRQMLTGWADSDWAGSQDCHRLTSEYVLVVDSFICSWSSCLQPTVANSSVEVEYVTLAAAAREMLWTSMFLHELDQSLPKMLVIHVTVGTTVLHPCNGDLALNLTIPILYSNSSGVCTIANDPQHSKRMKHIDIVHFFLRDEVADGHLTIALIQSSENLADILTKPLTVPTLSMPSNQIVAEDA